MPTQAIHPHNESRSFREPNHKATGRTDQFADLRGVTGRPRSNGAGGAALFSNDQLNVLWQLAQSRFVATCGNGLPTANEPLWQLLHAALMLR